jgi:tetratricopeptide (TPR) repeat protein
MVRLVLLVLLAALTSGCAVTGSRVPPDAKVGPGAIRLLEQRALDDPANPYWPYRLGQIHEAKGELASAESELRSALERDTAHAPSMSLLSKVYYDTGRHEEAVALLEGHPQGGAMPEELVLALALNYEALDRIEDAGRLVAPLEKRLTNWKSTGSAVAYLQLKGDAYRNSLEIAKKALEAEPSAANHNNYGIARLYAGKPEAAKKSFLTARKIDPELPGPLYNLAIVDWFYFFNAEGAREWFRRYREFSDEDPDGLADILTTELAETSTGLEEEGAP